LTTLQVTILSLDDASRCDATHYPLSVEPPPGANTQKRRGEAAYLQQQLVALPQYFGREDAAHQIRNVGGRG
jgi:hypothetical protein